MKREEINKMRGMINAENEMLEKTLLEAVHKGGDVSGIVSIINDNDAKLEELEDEVDDEEVEYVCGYEDLSESTVCATPRIEIPKISEDLHKHVRSCSVNRSERRLFLELNEFVNVSREPVSMLIGQYRESGEEFNLFIESRNMYGEKLFVERFDGCQVFENIGHTYVGNEGDGEIRAPHTMHVGIIYKGSKIII